MKIHILRNNLRQALSACERIASGPLSLPVLKYVLISIDKNFVRFSATNLEIGVRYWALAQVDREGKIAVPATFLSNFIASLPNKKVSAQTYHNTLYIKCGNYKTKVKGVSHEEFPIIPEINKDIFIQVNGQPFFQGLAQVTDYTAVTQTRPEISGVYLSFQKNGVIMAATDGFRLAEKKLSFDNPVLSSSFKPQSFILPHRTAHELINIFSQKDEKVKIYISPNQVLFEAPMEEYMPSPDVQQDGDGVLPPKTQVLSRLVEGNYPDYQDIIPDQYNTQAILPTDGFSAQIKAAGLFSRQNNEIKCRVDPEKGELEIFAENPDLGEDRSFVPAKVEGSAIEISFNWKFLLDGLSHIKSKEVIFGLRSEGEPAVLKPVGNDTYVYVVMPIKRN